MSGSCLLWSLDGWTQVLKQTAHLATMAYRSIPRVVWNGLRACQWIVSSGARQARCCRPRGCNCAAAAFLLDELSPLWTNGAGADAQGCVLPLPIALRFQS